MNVRITHDFRKAVAYIEMVGVSLRVLQKCIRHTWGMAGESSKNSTDRACVLNAVESIIYLSICFGAQERIYHPVSRRWLDKITISGFVKAV